MRFHGEVRDARALPHSIVSGGVPLIWVEVALGGHSRDIAFLIDTGADATVLHPTDAYRLLRGDLRTIDFDHALRRVPGLGVGGAVDRIVRDATLTLRSEDRRLHPIEMPILVARPIPSEPGDHGNWRLPSLLGRDFLRQFRLELFCGDRRQLTLETL